MPDRTAQRIEFGRMGRRVVEARFDGGDQSSDGGLMLRRRVDEPIGQSLRDGGMCYAELVSLAVGTDVFASLAGGRSSTQESLALLACQIDVNTRSVDLVGLADTGIEFMLPG